jgi:3-oxoacyl-[acyl-carrier-protein] synthase-1
LNNISTRIFTQAGAVITPFENDLQMNVEQVKGGISSLQYFVDEKFSENSFIAGRINRQKLEEDFSALSLNGTFSSLEKMMLLAIYQLLPSIGGKIPPDCGLIVSTTKGNIDALENGDIQNYLLQNMAHKIANIFSIPSPIVLSNACVSGIMAISVAKRLLQTGLYKHCIVVAGDLFSKFVFSGFNSFQALSTSICKPYDKNRDGINLGEAAAAIFVSGDLHYYSEKSIFEITGDSSINDANHISGPSRTGEGLYQSIQNALKMAAVSANEVDCISAHGTATLYNDEMEAQAFQRAQITTPVYSLKANFGHTLGAAGLLETNIGLQLASENTIPPSLGYSVHGVSLPLAVSKTLQKKNIRCFLKTASGFGGCNTAVLFKKI